MLFDLTDANDHIYCMSYVAGYLAKKLGTSAATFWFARGFFNRLGLPRRRLEKTFESFGAKMGASFATEPQYRVAAEKFAVETLRTIKTKMDFVNLAIDDVRVGHFIYDTYLRGGKCTLDFTDPALKTCLCDAYVIFQICKDYFQKNDVKALFTLHYVYMWSGIPVAFAISRKVPVFVFSTEPLFLHELTTEICTDENYLQYRQIFAAFPEADKVRFREQARNQLLERLSGKVDSGIAYMLAEDRNGLTGYGPKSAEPLFKNTGRPRCVVLLSCFFDAPHGYRYMLFPDHWEWLQWLLKIAAETPFDWYVKPHPAGLPGNDEFVDKLQQQFPHITFLPRTASNRQLAEEGIAAMFSVYGTAGHEFAYMGVPVVHAGDNSHFGYDFTFNPTTVEEYEGYVRNADRLRPDLNKAKIEEFFYMYYIANQKKSFGARCIPPEASFSKVGAKRSRSEIFDDYVRGESASEDAKLNGYFDIFFRKYFPDK